MEKHEAERIAAAMHDLRPDWPARQVLTLIRDNLAHKPARDVATALAWVAGEPASHSPYRVLENGPWWRAANVEAPPATTSPKGDPSRMCTVCARSEAECRRRAATNGHEFLAEADHVRAEPEVVRARATAPRPEAEEPEDDEDPLIVYLDRRGA